MFFLNGRRLNQRYQLIYQGWICFNKGKAYILIGHSIDNSLLRREKYYDEIKKCDLVVDAGYGSDHLST